MKGNANFVNEFDLTKETMEKIERNKKNITIKKINAGDLTFSMESLLTREETDLIVSEIDRRTWIPVGIDGIKSNYNENHAVGSYRLSCYEEKLAKAVWERIKPRIENPRIMKDDTPTDWDGHRAWEPIGVNPLFRFIRYLNDGVLIPHYDAPFIENEDVKSLSSLVIYLTDNKSGGGTRFLKDEQSKLPLAERDYSDRSEEASNEEVIAKVEPTKGGALLFDHRVLHDSEKMRGNEVKTIIRTDIMYRRIK